MQSHKIAIIGADTVGLTLAILLSKELPQYQFDLYDFD
jgi:2-polyprenyl-6-methoxyphenol hydroxylase-like FAD-dependent oxidoreductase